MTSRPELRNLTNQQAETDSNRVLVPVQRDIDLAHVSAWGTPREAVICSGARLASFDDDTLSSATMSQSNESSQAMNFLENEEDNINLNKMSSDPPEYEHDDGIKFVELKSSQGDSDRNVTTLAIVREDLPGDERRGSSVHIAEVATTPYKEGEVWLPPFSDEDDYEFNSQSRDQVVSSDEAGNAKIISTTEASCKTSLLSTISPGQRLHEAAVKVHAVVKFTRMQRLKKRARWLTKKLIVFILSHVGLTSLVGLYAVAGGFIFQYLEKDSKDNIVVHLAANISDHHRDIRKEYVNRLWNKTRSFNILHPVKWKEAAEEELYDFENKVYKAMLAGRPCDKTDCKPGTAREWTYPSALLFAITVITTIGYGDTVPQTPQAKVACMIYAVIGIPLTLLCLANIGSFLASVFKFTWKHTTHLGMIIVRAPRRNQALAETSQVRVPITVSVTTMVIYILGGAAIFCHWEDWTFLEGSYFCFITLSTIGFGDFVPGQDQGTLDSNAKRVVCALYLLFGLALLSTIFQLIQDSVTLVVRRYASLLGLSKAKIEKDIQDSEEEVVEVKEGIADASQVKSAIVVVNDYDRSATQENNLVYPAHDSTYMGSTIPGNQFPTADKDSSKLIRAQTYPLHLKEGKKRPELVSPLISLPEEEHSRQNSTAASLGGSKDSLLGHQENTDPVSVRNVLCKKYSILAQDPESQNAASSVQ